MTEEEKKEILLGILEEARKAEINARTQYVIELLIAEAEKSGDDEMIEALNELMHIKVSDEVWKRITSKIITPVPPDRPILSGEREDESNSAD